jgi:hypothetical protein
MPLSKTKLIRPYIFPKEIKLNEASAKEYELRHILHEADSSPDCSTLPDSGPYALIEGSAGRPGNGTLSRHRR